MPSTTFESISLDALATCTGGNNLGANPTAQGHLATSAIQNSGNAWRNMTRMDPPAGGGGGGGGGGGFGGSLPTWQ